MRFKPGQRVSLNNSPSTIGTVGEKHRERNDVVRFLVHWNDGSRTFEPEHDISLVAEKQDWFELLQEAKWGRPDNFRQSLTYIYLSGKLANIVYSMRTTSTDFRPFQYKPVLSFLESPSKGILIADEVGLGKTIEAGLIWSEIKARENAKRLLVLCPAHLREKWRDELSEKFGEEIIKIVNAKEIKSELEKEVLSIGKPQVLISSFQSLRPMRKREGIKQPKDREALSIFLEENVGNEALIDMLIVDEAHYMRNPQTSNHKLGRSLVNISENKVFLTATPINLKNQDLFHLLNLIDPVNFEYEDVFQKIIASNGPLLRAKDLVMNVDADAEKIRAKLEDSQRTDLLKNSSQLNNLLSTDLSSYLSTDEGKIKLANKIGRLSLLQNTYTQTLKKYADEELVFKRSAEAAFIDFDEDTDNTLERDFHEKALSAIRSYAKERNVHDEFLGDNAYRAMTSCFWAATQYWEKGALSQEYNDHSYMEDEDNQNEDQASLNDYLYKEVLCDFNPNDLRENDTKFNKFLSLIKELLEKNPSEKILVFSFFLRTVSYLEERLSEEGIASMTLIGGMNKSEVIDKFRTDNKAKILICSDSASEGVDLQFMHILINYDLPYNPMRIEQRIGRLDRYGQKCKQIIIWNLFHKGTVDEKIYSRLINRLDIIKDAIGVKYDVIGDDISKTVTRLIYKPLTPQKEEQILKEEALAMENKKRQEEQVENEASQLLAHGEYIIEQVKAANEFNKRITDEDVELYVLNFLNFQKQSYPGNEILLIDQDKKVYELILDIEFQADLYDFIEKENLQGQTSIGRDPSIKIRFKNKSGFKINISKEEIINQQHPLVRFISSKIDEENFFPLVSAQISKADLKNSSFETGIYLFSIAKWSFEGLTTKEELKPIFIKFGSNEYMTENDSWVGMNSIRLKSDKWLSIHSDLEPFYNELEDIFEETIKYNKDKYEEELGSQKAENDDRINIQTSAVKEKLGNYIQTAQDTLDKWKVSGINEKQYPMQEGKINSLKNRLDLQVAKLQRKKQIKGQYKEVCVGVLRIND